MCIKCKPLIECPVGQKRSNVVDRERREDYRPL